MNIQKHKELEQEVVQRAKAQIVSQTAAGVAHDLNNYLTVIRSQVENGLDSISPGHPAHRSLLEAQRAIAACSHMAQQLLDVGRTVPRQTVQVSVNSLLREAATLSKHLMTATTTLQVDPCDDDVLIQCAPAELQQALMNLILNARDALSDSGVVILSAYRLPQGKEQTPPGVAITVRDNGSGIAPHFIDRIFEPYFTTKEGRGGTGLGLSNVRTSIELQGGTIEVDSTEGVGTEFRIIFPVVTTGHRQAAPSAQSHRESEHELSVLVADDDEGVRNILLSNIARMGHRAYGVSDGQALIAMVQEGLHTYDAILLDDSMPKARGLDLIPRLTALSPRSKVILTSGDPRIESVAAQLKPAPFFLAKPFGLKELREALASSPGVAE
jgi:CheY-like chemotaxis protein